MIISKLYIYKKVKYMHKREVKLQYVLFLLVKDLFKKKKFKTLNNGKTIGVTNMFQIFLI